MCIRDSSLVGDTHDYFSNIRSNERFVLKKDRQSIQRRLDRRADRPALDVGIHDLVDLAESLDQLLRLRLAAVGDEETALAGEGILHTGKAVRDHRRRRDAVAGRHAAEVEGLLDVLLVAHPAGNPRCLLRGIGKQMANLFLVESEKRTRGSSGAEQGPETVRRMSVLAELEAIQEHR